MAERNYQIDIKGVTPILMHWDNIEWTNTMSAWEKDAKNKKKSKAGDDRTPAWRWIGSLYHDGAQIALPTDNVMRAFMDAGKTIPKPVGRGTLKSETQSGIIPLDAYAAFSVGGSLIELADVQELIHEEEFSKHVQRVKDLGFQLLVKRAAVGQSKHIRVRPRFDRWALSMRVLVIEDAITTDVLQSLVEIAGSQKGMGDWRPSAPRSPGPWGRFSGMVSEV